MTIDMTLGAITGLPSSTDAVVSNTSQVPVAMPVWNMPNQNGHASEMDAGSSSSDGFLQTLAKSLRENTVLGEALESLVQGFDADIPVMQEHQCDVVQKTLEVPQPSVLPITSSHVEALLKQDVQGVLDEQYDVPQASDVPPTHLAQSPQLAQQPQQLAQQPQQLTQQPQQLPQQPQPVAQDSVTVSKTSDVPPTHLAQSTQLTQQPQQLTQQPQQLPQQPQPVAQDSVTVSQVPVSQSKHLVQPQQPTLQQPAQSQQLTRQSQPVAQDSVTVPQALDAQSKHLVQPQQFAQKPQQLTLSQQSLEQQPQQLVLPQQLTQPTHSLTQPIQPRRLQQSQSQQPQPVVQDTITRETERVVRDMSVDAALDLESEDEPPVLPTALPITIEVPKPVVMADTQNEVVISEVSTVDAQEIVSSSSAMILETVHAVADSLLVSPGLLRGDGEMLIQLKPDVFDGSQIRLTMMGRSISIQITPSTHVASEVLKAHASELQTHLTQTFATFGFSVLVLDEMQGAMTQIASSLSAQNVTSRQIGGFVKRGGVRE